MSDAWFQKKRKQPADEGNDMYPPYINGEKNLPDSDALLWIGTDREKSAVCSKKREKSAVAFCYDC